MSSTEKSPPEPLWYSFDGKCCPFLLPLCKVNGINLTCRQRRYICDYMVPSIQLGNILVGNQNRVLGLSKRLAKLGESHAWDLGRGPFHLSVTAVRTGGLTESISCVFIIDLISTIIINDVRPRCCWNLQSHRKVLVTLFILLYFYRLTKK